MEENEVIMDPQAVCDTEFSDEIMKPAFSYMVRASTILFIVLIAVASVLLVLSLVFNQTALAIYCAVIIVIDVLVMMYTRTKNIKQRIQAYRSTNGNRLHLEFYDTSVKVVAENGSMSYNYTSFIKAVELRTIWLIYMGDNKYPMVLLVPKDGFRNESEYRFFLEKSVEPLDAKKVIRLKNRNTGK